MSSSLMVACDGRGLCAELLPGLITLDDWGFPVVPAVGVPADLAGEAPGSSAPTSASGRLDT